MILWPFGRGISELADGCWLEQRSLPLGRSNLLSYRPSNVISELPPFSFRRHEWPHRQNSPRQSKTNLARPNRAYLSSNPFPSASATMAGPPTGRSPSSREIPFDPDAELGGSLDAIEFAPEPPPETHTRAHTRTHVRTRVHAHVAATFDYFQPDLPSRRERLRSNRDLLLKREGGSASGPAQPNPTDVTESQMTDRTIYFVTAPRQLCSAVENVPLLFSSNKSDTKRFPPGGTRPLLIDA